MRNIRKSRQNMSAALPEKEDMLVVLFVGADAIPTFRRVRWYASVLIP